MFKDYEHVTFSDIRGETEPMRRIQKSFAIASNPIVSIIFLFIGCLVSIAQIVIGALNFNNCAIQPMIPIWLIVQGAGGILASIIGITNNLLIQLKSKTSLILQLTSCFISLVFFVWFILGNVWVYSVWKVVDYNTNSSNYCDYLTFGIAFWPISIANSMLILGCGSFILVCCCSCLIACCFSN